MKHSLRILVLLFVGAGCTAPSPLPEPVGPVADFSLTERGGRTITKKDLLGKVWVTSFIFTRCAGPCPQITGSMARLQGEMKGQPDFRLVTITVDPEHDTPPVLANYAERFNADPERWLFLTGEPKAVYGLIRDSFKLHAEQTKEPDRRPGEEVFHSTKLALVDRQGQVRAYFDGRQVDEMGQPAQNVPLLLQQIKALLREKS